METTAVPAPAAHRIHLLPSGAGFECGAEETLLDAALRQGLLLPHQCKTGTCGSCRATDAADGRALLLCQVRPATDMTLDATVLAEGQVVRKLPVRVLRLQRLADDVVALFLQPPEGREMAFRPGQYVDVLLPRGLRRSYSLAARPEAGAVLELHVRHRRGGTFTEQVFERMKERDVLRLEGPYGACGRKVDGDKPLLLLATGTGFAPVKAVVEHAIATGSQRPMTLYWGGRTLADLYQHTLCKAWAAAHPWLVYRPVLSRATPGHAWGGRTGRIHHAAMADFQDLSAYEVYACGSPAMVDEARAVLCSQRGLSADAFHADAFTTAAVPAAVA